ncbi:Crp/Fnr family transcriptional regulator [Hydrogenophaga sp.]|uniref:Crp/Fnr family transcriptional regulator n=1 Tax=Hydrogenophaga sp. TaxID=1904254 RepID=UPI002718A34F|nr:Crp/Fnr family transcriptional regulator [Hydrogenophaga sp.]MDO8906763.1 Crp/Fnr family transcriptional regulator [Hydrogenophaga sp.]
MEPYDARQNRLLASLPDAEWQRWKSRLEPVDLPQGTVVHEAGAKRSFVYFPTSAIFSMLYVLSDGSSVEIAVVGFEGLLGGCTFLGDGTTPTSAVVLSAGMAYRLPAELLKAEFERSCAVRHLMLRYSQALITQMSQTAVCNRHHKLENQLSRWLLLCLDRSITDELVVTQKLIADMLGVRREGVTEAAHKLQAAGLIRYARGHIWVLDRPGLERHTCECYQIVKDEYDRLLPALEAV